jgi:hypothetical protein
MMRIVRTTVYHVIVGGILKLPFEAEPTVEDLRAYHWFNEQAEWSIERVSGDVPFTVGRTEHWDGGGVDFPHVHYSCPHCGEEHNFDLDAKDPNPRIACCERSDVTSYTLVQWQPADVG